MLRFNVGSIVIASSDPSSAATWWEETFECRRVAVPDYWDDSADCIALTFPGAEEPAVCLSPKARNKNMYPVPVIFSSNIKKAHQHFTERGVAPGAIEGDDPRHFDLRDGEGNSSEICEEP